MCVRFTDDLVATSNFCVIAYNAAQVVSVQTLHLKSH